MFDQRLPRPSPSAHDAATPLTRREMLGLGLGSVASLMAFPNAFAAATGTRAEASFSAARPELDVALKAARWIRTARIETPNGVTWPADPTKPESVSSEFYNGMPGVVLFHLELFYATGDKAWLDEGRAGANELIAQLSTLDKAANCGLYTGLAGAAFVLEETHRATGEGRYRDAARRCVEMIRSHAQIAGAGVAWSGESATNDIISGNAGIGLFLLWVAERQVTDAAATRALAASAGRRLLDTAQPANGGMKWAVAPTMKNLYPNFSHGTAGVSYFLATLYQATGDRSFLDAALAGARYLQAVANTDGGGLKVFHHEPGGEALFYLSWCHGPAGTSRLFYRLAEITRDERWRGLIRQAAVATIGMGVPEQRSPGYWNNISQCCGNCGVGEYFLSLQRHMPDPSYGQMVRRVAADTLRRATSDGDGLKWVQAENRVSPDVVIAQTGYMQGASGVGSLFIHIDASMQRRTVPIAWPDSPFT